MRFTDEQRTAVQQQGDQRVTAAPGTGKTTLAYGYSLHRADPLGRKNILYLTFTSNSRKEAKLKFGSIPVKNTNFMLDKCVDIHTAHSLAYNRMGIRFQDVAAGYSLSDLVQLLGIVNQSKIFDKYKAAAYARALFACYCNSNAQEISQVEFLRHVPEDKVEMVGLYYNFIEAYATRLWQMMENGRAKFTHDFYLKKFQLSKPKLSYEYIIFDEAQDASPVMLDIFNTQRCTKVMIGDPNQQIYSWRYAINALQQMQDCQTNSLTQSFRFDQRIADSASKILEFKKWIYPGQKLAEIKGLRTYSGDIKTIACIARTNIKLLEKAIQLCIDSTTIEDLYFEGNFQSYLYTDDGISIYDILNLFLDNKSRIRSEFIASMEDFQQLITWSEQVGENQLVTMCKIVDTYQDRLFDIIKQIKEKLVPEREKHLADCMFTTCHKAKGMEYDEVIVCDDFICEDDIAERVKQADGDSKKLLAIEESVNLIYVAATRAKKHLTVESVPYLSVQTAPVQIAHV